MLLLSVIFLFADQCNEHIASTKLTQNHGGPKLILKTKHRKNILFILLLKKIPLTNHSLNY